MFSRIYRANFLILAQTVPDPARSSFSSLYQRYSLAARHEYRSGVEDDIIDQKVRVDGVVASFGLCAGTANDPINNYRTVYFPQLARSLSDIEKA